MKKIASIILTLIITVNIIPVHSVFSADSHDADVLRAVSLLEDIGLSEGGEDNSESITRAEFVARIVKTLNLTLSYSFEASPFSDVDAQNEYYYEICNALSWGIVSPSANFRPSDPITYYEAIKTAVSACGYTFLAEVYGGYPTGYTAAADRVGLADSVRSDVIDRGAMFVIMYNILNCKLPEQEYTSEGAVNTLNAHKTVLETMWHLKKMSGTIDSARYFGGTDGFGAGEGCFCINGVKMRSGDFNTDKYYAREVDVYYDSKYTTKSLYVYDENDTSDVLVLNSYDDVTFDSDTYTYYNSRDKELKAKISKTALIVYNGKKAVYNLSRMMPQYGSVTLIKNGGSTYDTVIINSYVQLVADEVDYDDMIISDYYDNRNVVNLKNASTVSVYDQNDTVAEFADIGQLNIVWVAQSDDGDLADIIISRDKIAGEYTGSGADGAIYIDGGLYYKDSGIARDFMADVNYGEVIIAYFNANREVAYVEKEASASGINAAYLIRTGVFGEGMEKTIKAKMLLSDGSVQSFDFAEKFTINGTPYSGDVQTLYDNRLPKDADYSLSMPIGIVSYILNSQNKIAKINYPDSSLSATGGSYANLYTKKSLDKTDVNSYEKYYTYRASEFSLYGKGVDRIFVTDKTIQFMVPEPKDTGIAQDSDYVVKLMSSYSGETKLLKMCHTGYGIKDDAYKSDYIVSSYELSNDSGAALNTVSSAELAYLVTNISNVIAANGDYAEKIEAVDYQNRPITLYSDKENYFTDAGVVKGAVIKAEFNTKNIVNGINILYKPGDTAFCNTTDDKSSSSYIKTENDGAIISDSDMLSLGVSYLVLANLWDKEDPIYSFLPVNNNPQNYDGTQQIHTYHMPKHITQFVCYDIRTGNVSYIKPAEVKCYGGIAGSNHYAVIEMSYGMVDSIFLYE